MAIRRLHDSADPSAHPRSLQRRVLTHPLVRIFSGRPNRQPSLEISDQEISDQKLVTRWLTASCLRGHGHIYEFCRPSRWWVLFVCRGIRPVIRSGFVMHPAPIGDPLVGFKRHYGFRFLEASLFIKNWAIPALSYRAETARIHQAFSRPRIFNHV
jgi:hypothetical protein